MKAAALKRRWAPDLTKNELYDILRLRIEVFVVEQASAYPDLDGCDLRANTRHLWLEQDGSAICTLRILEEYLNGDACLRISRLCTGRSARGHGHTTRLLRAALAEAGSSACLVMAPMYLIQMYESHGFFVDGQEILLDGISHISMRRTAVGSNQAS